MSFTLFLRDFKVRSTDDALSRTGADTYKRSKYFGTDAQNILAMQSIIYTHKRVTKNKGVLFEKYLTKDYKDVQVLFRSNTFCNLYGIRHFVLITLSLSSIKIFRIYRQISLEICKVVFFLLNEAYQSKVIFSPFSQSYRYISLTQLDNLSIVYQLNPIVYPNIGDISNMMECIQYLNLPKFLLLLPW